MRVLIRLFWAPLVFVLICLVFTALIIAQANKDDAEAEQECRNQGGTVIKIDYHRWCVINGQKFEF